MLNLLATLLVSTLPASPAGFSACPDPTPAAAQAGSDVGADVGECEQAAPLDLWYRMSRFAEVDPGSAGAAPARRPQASRGVVSADAPQTPAQISPPQAPPVALFAVPGLLPLHVPSHFDGDARALPARAIAPPERPPRA
jgi:hypothetical protein